ncbi:MAG: YidC/Oxa1 family insertase periplasmic-domain containing protein [Pirellulales bacterium]|nr:YidC/Oxa1 family insertase periplasmic-domain containing protein [Pirellulales bacterium]
MERRFVLFLVLSFAVLFGHMALMARLNPRPKKDAEVAAPGDVAQQPAEPASDPEKEPPGQKPPQQPPEEDAAPKPADKPQDQPPKPAAAPEEIPSQWITLGSGDPKDPYRMLVTLTSHGAAVARIELNSPRYTDLDDRSGYLGHLIVDASAAEKASAGKGCPVQVVGPGTPAAEAGLKPGDLIVALRDRDVTREVTDPDALDRLMEGTRPKRTIELTVLRDGQKLSLPVKLERRPLEVVRPEGDDPLSFLLTLQQIDDQKLIRDEAAEGVDPGGELEGLDLWTGNWEVTARNESSVTFRRLLTEKGLELTKTYRLARVPAEKASDADHGAYHLVFDVGMRNIADKPHQVAYQLDGPTGLPAEGAWYAYKVGRAWTVGLRDVVVSFDHAIPSQIGCPKIADDSVGKPWQDQSLTYIGVDAQYFAAVLLPQKEDPSAIWFSQSQPLRVGPVNEEQKKLTNTSCRMISKVHELAPGQSLSHRFEIFAGPKKPAVLAHYGLDELVYYGWFSYFARPMSWILHAFYAVVGNYGLAILMLTVLVRGCMFPLSKKQALGAQKMQQLQPEIKKLQEKYKKDVEGRTKAQQELFRKHNYNPLSGCLVLFVQLPIFVALYRSLSVDIELRQAPLLSQSIRWCSNLAAPDMLFDWSRYMPDWFNAGSGMFALGPYFNLLPILTIILFIVQQKMFMPPATDEQTAMQQKIMQYMMIFIGVMFFKVASGLCIYFVASSFWGLAERKLLPKHTPAAAAEKPQTRADAKALAARTQAKTASQPASDRNGGSARKSKKSRGKK